MGKSSDPVNDRERLREKIIGLGERSLRKTFYPQLQEKLVELSVAKERAEAASRAKSEFLSSASHELRTPLNAIMGYTEILKRQENLTQTQRQQLELLHINSQHLLTLINDILDVSKIETEKMEPEDVVFKLPALLEQVSNVTRTKAEEKMLDFQYEELTPFPEYVRGDEGRLKQILLSLSNNAVRYTRRGGVTLRMSYDVTAGGLFRCEVSDTGIGIHADRLEAIFEPFSQLAREGQVTEGIGLGLTITRHLVTLMDGKMGVESEPEKGSTFRVELPLPPATEGRSGPEGGSAAVSAAPATTEAGEEEGIPMPSPAEVVELYELAMLGDMQKIRTWATQLEEKDVKYRAFADRLRELARGFKTKAIVVLVEDIREKER